MRYWLLKTEPIDYSFDDLENEPSGTVWDGVKNFAALKQLRDMHEGDRAIVYHTGTERRAVGIAEVTSDPYPDPKEDDERIVVVDVAVGPRLGRPVTLDELKRQELFDGHPLLRQPRLSVMELAPELWERILTLGSG